jgi:nitroreductase
MAAPTGKVKEVIDPLANRASTATDSNMHARLLEEVIKTRRSVRHFAKELVPENVIRDLVDQAQWAPSSCNFQAWDFIVVTDEAVKEKLCMEYRVERLVMKAPVSIIVCYDARLTDENWANLQSAAAALQNMFLYAHAIGLGGVWICNLGQKEEVKKYLQIPDQVDIVAIASFGWPGKDKAPRAPKRKNLDDIIHWQKFQRSHVLPVSQHPDDWTLDDIRTYHTAKIRSKSEYFPSYYCEFDTVVSAVERALRDRGKKGGRWLDLFPCKGVYLNEFEKRFSGFSFEYVELADETALFHQIGNRKAYLWREEEIPRAQYDVVSAIFRFEALPQETKEEVIQSAAAALKGDGVMLLAFINDHSYVSLVKQYRKLIGHGFVQNTIDIAPNLGPFAPMTHGEIRHLLASVGLKWKNVESHYLGPSKEEIDGRVRNVEVIPSVKKYAGFFKAIAPFVTVVSQGINLFTPTLSRFAKIQFYVVTK